MKKKLLAAGILFALAQPATAASFTVGTGQTVTAGQTLAAGDAGTVNAGGTLSIGSDTVAVTVTGNSTLVNNGTIIQTGTGRDIRDNSGHLTLTVTNNAGAVMQAADGDVIQMNKGSSSITFNNYGTLTSLNASNGGSQAIDFNAISSGSNVLNNYATGVIQANEADAVRPGVGGYVYNDGLIKSTNNPGSTDGSDGIDAQSNSNITIVNASTTASGTIEGARHGITGGNTDGDGTYAMSVTNNLGGTIQGDNGAGINIDGINGNELVTVVNHGTITGNGVQGDGDGVDVDGLVNLTNSGTIKSLHAYNDTSEGVTVGGGTIVNSGTIEGDNAATNADGTANSGTGRGITLAGIDKDPTTGTAIPVQGIYGNTSITNSGLIRGQSDSAIAVTGAANTFTVTITNLAGGTLEGGGSAAAVYTGGNDATIVDYGIITADSSHLAVDLGSGNSSLQILGGAAAINGDISGGTGTSTLTIVPGAGNAFTYAGSISHFASVAIGSGTTTLNGASSYTGDTTLSGGTLVLGNSGAIGSGQLLASDATVVYRNGIALANAISLQGTATLEVDGSDTATQAGAIAGGYGIAKTGSGTLVLDGNNVFTGTATINAGTLEVGDAQSPSATLGGNVQVAAGGMLRGHGSIGGNVTNAGTVWPGASIGTLTIQGNYTQTASGTLNIDATPDGQSSRLAVAGKANLAGGAVVLAQAGNWAPRTDYTILTASQGISGQFASASSSLAFLTPVLAYGNNAVTLSLERNDVSFASVAQTANQRATAAAVESLGWNSAVYNAVVTAEAGEARRAFDQLSGQGYASTRTTLLDDSRYVREAINGHLLGVNNGANGLSATSEGGVTAWTAGWGHWGDHDGDGNASRLTADGSGLLVGADLPVGALARLGAVVGYGQSSTGVDALGSSSHATGTHLGVYGDVASGGWQLRGALAYTWQTVDSHRGVAFNGFQGRYDSEYDANTAQAYLDGSYAFALGAGTLSPFLDVAHVRLHTDAASESGGPAALDAGAQDDSATYATLGLRGVFALDASGGLRAHLGLGWQHAWGDTATSSTLRFQAGGTAFTVDGVPVARNAAAFDAGLSFALSRSVAVDASYQGQYASHASDQAARVSLTWAF